LWYPGGIYHLISRCVNKEYLLAGAEERRRYLSLLARAASKTDADLLAYGMMSTHNHLAVRAGQQPLSSMMKSVNSAYALWKNEKEGRLGPLFADRYKAILVEDEHYLLELVRYIHNNVVRAGLVKLARESWWASHNVYLGRQDCPAWLNPDLVLERFSSDQGRARALFDAFVNDGAGEERRLDLTGAKTVDAAKASASRLGDSWRIMTPIVGSEAFVQKVIRSSQPGLAESRHPLRTPPDQGTVSVFHRAVCDALDRKDYQALRRSGGREAVLARKLVALLWIEDFGGSQACLARYYRKNSSTISKTYWGAVAARSDLAPLLEKATAYLSRQFEEERQEDGQEVNYRILVASG